jgi:small subunit ribosomal protein S2
VLAGGEASSYTKKERLTLQRERDKLDRSLGGIKEMGGLPDMIFVIDTNKEQLAIQEAKRLGIPVAAIIDSNCDPDGITYPVPANDDAGRAISLYCDLVARAAIDGISRGQGSLGVDVGASVSPIAEELPAEVAAPAGEAFELLTAPRGAPDDLSKLSTMSPIIEKKLNDAGIFHFWQIAAMGPAEVAQIDTAAKLGGRIDREGWVAQARGFLENA